MSVFLIMMTVIYLPLFFLLGILLGAYSTVFSKDPVYSILALAFTFINAAFLCISMDLEFISLVFLLVYAGAIIILFLFTIMLMVLKNQITERTAFSKNQKKILFLFSLILLLLFFISFTFFFETCCKEKNFVEFNLIKDLIENFSFKLEEQDAYILYTTSINFFTYQDIGFNFTSSSESELETLGLVLYSFGQLYIILVGVALLLVLLGVVYLIAPSQNEGLEFQVGVKQQSRSIK